MESNVEVELIKQGADLMKALIWPIVALFIIFKYRQALGKFFNRLTDFTLKTPVGEFSAAAKIGSLLGAAQSARSDDDGGGDAETAANVRAVSQSVEAGVRASARLQAKSILWVDDIPAGNRYEIEAFEALGIRVDKSLTTDDAMRRITRTKYDLIITDLTRGSDSSAGLKFIRLAKALNPTLRILVYSSRRGEHQYSDAKAAGAAGATFSTNELFDMTVNILSS